MQYFLDIDALDIDAAGAIGCSVSLYIVDCFARFVRDIHVPINAWSNMALSDRRVV